MAGSCFFAFFYGVGGKGTSGGRGRAGRVKAAGTGSGAGNTKALTALNEGHRWNSLRISEEILSSGPLESLL